MKKDEIIDLLDKEHQDLFDWLEGQPDENWVKGPEGKWTTGQHVLHLVDAIKWKDTDLDTLILPHPLLGKMPIREIVMWTAHHTAHHTRTLIENY